MQRFLWSVICDKLSYKKYIVDEYPILSKLSYDKILIGKGRWTENIINLNIIAWKPNQTQATFTVLESYGGSASWYEKTVFIFSQWKCHLM